jgi:hypothetical protein
MPVSRDGQGDKLDEKSHESKAVSWNPSLLFLPFSI